MPPRKMKKKALSLPVPKMTVTIDRLKAVLAKRKKSELIDVIVGIAKADRGIQRQLESRFGVETPPVELIAATRVAIADATDFDEREINYNFDYDDEAYGTVKRNLARLIELGHLREAMELAQEVMSEGSCQVEMSDEGLMTEDIEECLQVVITAVAKSDLPAAEVAAWCADMTKRDRIGVHCDSELAALANSVER
ncbi:MAG: hypothetical protein H6822_15430 [Planctomycetaceae bacterium]|nr:hypothetical protein [Planctomycetales bacterium]MCB9923572.1 hypothetical protein [Planctomycetaceae bacterium]